MTDSNHDRTLARGRPTSSVPVIFESLAGTWRLVRQLQSANSAEPSGQCTGTASFTPREPSVFIGPDGKLEQAVGEMVYHEEGEFELRQLAGTAAVPRFPFSRKYIWRLQRDDAGRDKYTLNVWFTKPGTEQIDYLFHRINMSSAGLDTLMQDRSGCSLEGNGGHLCEQDLYNSSYTFLLEAAGDEEEASDYRVRGWTMLHEVRGPAKEQTIETLFSRLSID